MKEIDAHLQTSNKTWSDKKTMIVSHDDPRLSWHGHVSLEKARAYTRPWRIPFAEKTLFPDALLETAATQAGVRLTFISETRRIGGRIVAKKPNQKLDLCIDGAFYGSVDLDGQESFVFADLPARDKRIELWLPQRGDFALQELELDENVSLRPYVDERPRWVTYGSSITHCREASLPTRTWPAIVARDRNVNLTNLGFGGQCHLDINIARLMRDIPADYLSICAGINIYRQSSLNARTFPASLIGFVRILREKHPATPLLLISPIYSFERETTPNNAGWTLQDYRSSVEETVERMRGFGDENVHYLNGLALFDQTHGHLMPDQLHPGAEGYQHLACNFLRHAVPLLGM